jgi:hypothetical protein
MIVITTNHVPGCLASYSLYFAAEDERRFFGAGGDLNLLQKFGLKKIGIFELWQ